MKRDPDLDHILERGKEILRQYNVEEGAGIVECGVEGAQGIIAMASKNGIDKHQTVMSTAITLGSIVAAACESQPQNLERLASEAVSVVLTIAHMGADFFEGERLYPEDISDIASTPITEFKTRKQS